MTFAEAEEILRQAPPEYHFTLERQGKLWWSSKEVADALGLTTNAVNKWLSADPGVIPGAYQIPGGWNMPHTALTVFLAEFYQHRGFRTGSA
jgi:hypothetical protein